MEGFVDEYFDQNPISQVRPTTGLSISGVSRSTAHLDS